jgi:ABC-type sulfate/molybdate transport systems ATPase subunit
VTLLLELREIAVVPGGTTILALERLGIAAGETLAVLGANGAGKSTLLRVAGGLRRPDRGQVLLHGLPATPQQIRDVSAAVLQRPLLRRGTVRANVETGLRFRRVRERRGRAERWIERLGLEGVADRQAAGLSGGEAQRVSLARALALAPELLLLDEPFGALDLPTRSELLADLRDILAATATAALLVTHDRFEAAAVADRIAILHAGRVRQLGPAPSVLDQPADADCARLLGFENVVGPELASRLLGRATRHSLAVRAADCRLDPRGKAARVVRIVPFGAVVRAFVSIDGTRMLVDTPAPQRLGALRPGSPVDVLIDEAAARALA